MQKYYRTFKAKMTRRNDDRQRKMIPPTIKNIFNMEHHVFMSRILTFACQPFIVYNFSL